MNEVELLQLCEIFKRHNLINSVFVIAKDEIHTVKVNRLPCAIIQNTCTRNGYGLKHWIVHVIYRYNGITFLDTFDSLGKNHKIKLGMVEVVHRNLNKFDIQSNSPSNICGLYCLWFIFIRLYNTSTCFNFSTLTNKAKNDKLVSLFYKKLIVFQKKTGFYSSVFEIRISCI